ncbi:hypothetical protein DES34_104282 [Brevibacillus brevis]|nr:hypothetical protein DES34_104282 [Brevibacillus brevis]VEF89799.1 Uncharacterised protein [Brevibacillus brevis]
MGKMLQIFEDYPIEVSCPIPSTMNGYYEKSGLEIERKNERLVFKLYFA